MTKDDKVLECLDLLVYENVNAAFQALILALANWLEEAHQDGRIPYKTDAIEDYEVRVHNVVAMGRYRRRPAPKGNDSTTADVTQRIVVELRALPTPEALDFLSELTGAWILECPRQLIVESDKEISKVPHKLETEADFTLLMEKWLFDSLSVGGL